MYENPAASTLFIGLRRWKPDALGLNRRGLAVSLGSGLLLVGGRVLVMLAVSWGKAPLYLWKIHPRVMRWVLKHETP